jgi:hypothetical protein
MQLTQEGIKKLQEQQKAVYWKIRDISRRFEINRQDQDISLEDSVDILQDFLGQLKGELILVTLYTTVPGKRVKGQEYDSGLDVKFKPNDAGTSINPGNISGIGLKEYLELKDQMQKIEIDRIRRELETDKKPGFLETMLSSSQGQQLIGALITFMQPKQQTTTAQPIKGNKLEEALELIRQQGEDPEHLIICLAKYAAKNPGVLATIKPIIGA